MDKKIRVAGNSPARAALGVTHAMVMMGPDLLLHAYRKTFPASEVCPDGGVKELFMPASEAKKMNTPSATLYFTNPIELLIMGNKTPVAFAAQWSDESFARLMKKIENWPIEVTIDESIEDPIGFKLECVNGYVPPKRKGCLGLPILAAVITIIAAALFC